MDFMYRVYVDIILLVIVCLLTIFMCVYGFYFVYRVLRTQRHTLLRPRTVLFSHKNVEDSNEELRTVVAYRNPFTGDYCVHKSRVGPKGYSNAAESPDSGVSDAYEPLHLEPQVPGWREQPQAPGWRDQRPRLLPMPPGLHSDTIEPDVAIKLPNHPSLDDNCLNKTWNWNYKEYQI